MIIVSEVVGSLDDNKLLLQDYQMDTIQLEHWESSKSRLRKKTARGREIAIALERGKHLHNKDVLYIDHDNRAFITVEFQLKNVLKITLNGNPDIKTVFKLGHALGNQHWPAILEHGAVYVPLYVDEKIMRSMLKTHNFDDIDIEFISGDELSKTISASDCRLLFSGDDATPHKHH